MSLDVVKLEDYNDFPFNNSPSLYDSQTNSHNNSHNENEDDFEADKIPSLKTKFHEKVASVPKAKRTRITEFRQQVAFIEDQIDRGNADVWKRAMGRMLQLRNELDGIIDAKTGEGMMDIRPPQNKVEARLSKADMANHSGLKMKRQSGGKKSGNDNSDTTKIKASSGTATKKRKVTSVAATKQPSITDMKRAEASSGAATKISIAATSIAATSIAATSSGPATKTMKITSVTATKQPASTDVKQANEPSMRPTVVEKKRSRGDDDISSEDDNLTITQLGIRKSKRCRRVTEKMVDVSKKK